MIEKIFQKLFLMKKGGYMMSDYAIAYIMLDLIFRILDIHSSAQECSFFFPQSLR